MAPRETEDNAYANFLGGKQRALWYVMVFSGVVNSTENRYKTTLEERTIRIRAMRAKLSVLDCRLAWEIELKTAVEIIFP